MELRINTQSESIERAIKTNLKSAVINDILIDKIGNAVTIITAYGTLNISIRSKSDSPDRELVLYWSR